MDAAACGTIACAADGLKIAPWYVIEDHDWVQIVAIDNEEHLIVVRQYRHGVGLVTLEIPAGLIDHTGDDVLAAGARGIA